MLKEKLKFWKKMLKLIKKDARKNYTAWEITPKEIDEQLDKNYNPDNYEY